MIIDKRDYNFVQFLAAKEDDNFELHQDQFEWFGKYVQSISSTLLCSFHRGDCTKQAYTCEICLIENLLN